MKYGNNNITSANVRTYKEVDGEIGILLTLFTQTEVTNTLPDGESHTFKISPEEASLLSMHLQNEIRCSFLIGK